jgi:hypothetical protein
VGQRFHVCNAKKHPLLGVFPVAFSAVLQSRLIIRADVIFNDLIYAADI